MIVCVRGGSAIVQKRQNGSPFMQTGWNLADAVMRSQSWSKLTALEACCSGARWQLLWKFFLLRLRQGMKQGSRSHDTCQMMQAFCVAQVVGAGWGVYCRVPTVLYDHDKESQSRKMVRTFGMHFSSWVLMQLMSDALALCCSSARSRSIIKIDLEGITDQAMLPGRTCMHASEHANNGALRIACAACTFQMHACLASTALHSSACCAACWHARLHAARHRIFGHLQTQSSSKAQAQLLPPLAPAHLRLMHSRVPSPVQGPPALGWHIRLHA